MLEQICKLVGFSSSARFQNESGFVSHGTLIPKDGKCYRVLILQDNPDIYNVNLEKKMTTHALTEYRKRLPYDIKVYDLVEWNNEFHSDLFNKPDVTIEFVDPLNDEYFTDNVNAYGGYPNGRFKGIIRFNNARIWLDGKNISGKKAKELGLVKNANDLSQLLTYNYKRTIKHEFGHVIGLEHCTGVMSAFYDYTENMLSKNSLFVLEKLYGLRSVGSRWLIWMKSVMTRSEF